MTNNFTPKKSGTAARPQLSPEEYAAKKKAEKDVVYQMIDDTAAEIVHDPDKFRAYLDTQARMDCYSDANALLRAGDPTQGFRRLAAGRREDQQACQEHFHSGIR